MKFWQLWVWLWGWCALTASAHEIRPAIATLSLQPSGVLTLSLETNAEAWLADINPALSDTDDSPNAPEYDRYRALTPEALEQTLADEIRRLGSELVIESQGQRVAMTAVRWQVLDEPDPELPRFTLTEWVGGLPEGAQQFVYEVAPRHPNTAVRFLPEGTDAQVAFVKTGERSPPFSLDGAVTRSTWEIVWSYVELGFTHILPRGIDHMVFILGLVLISKRWIDLLVQVTAFTVAHSVTLAAGLYGVLTLPVSVVEPLIAASIIYIAVENCWHRTVTRSRTLVVFLFGLLHGLGFAGILTELGLPERDFVVGLLSFNLGVELGQLALIVLAYYTVGVWVLDKPWYRARVAIPVSLLIGAAGSYWLIERVMA